eukprot:3956205-Lingulodinium_polyedra.AAC.1
MPMFTVACLCVTVARLSIVCIVSALPYAQYCLSEPDLTVTVACSALSVTVACSAFSVRVPSLVAPRTL